jgi:phosphate/sulfate permease
MTLYPDMVLVWIITLPVSALLTAVTYLILSRLL